MAAYPEVPDWWYLAVFATMFVAGAVAIELWKSQLPIWALVMALALSFAYVLPVGIILAVTNQQVSSWPARGLKFSDRRCRLG
jgi:hypothetical protein